MGYAQLQAGLQRACTRCCILEHAHSITTTGYFSRIYASKRPCGSTYAICQHYLSNIGKIVRAHTVFSQDYHHPLLKPSHTDCIIATKQDGLRHRPEFNNVDKVPSFNHDNGVGQKICESTDIRQHAADPVTCDHHARMHSTRDPS